MANQCFIWLVLSIGLVQLCSQVSIESKFNSSNVKGNNSLTNVYYPTVPVWKQNKLENRKNDSNNKPKKYNATPANDTRPDHPSSPKGSYNPKIENPKSEQKKIYSDLPKSEQKKIYSDYPKSEQEEINGDHPKSEQKEINGGPQVSQVFFAPFLFIMCAAVIVFLVVCSGGDCESISERTTTVYRPSSVRKSSPDIFTTTTSSRPYTTSDTSSGTSTGFASTSFRTSGDVRCFGSGTATTSFR